MSVSRPTPTLRFGVGMLLLTPVLLHAQGGRGGPPAVVQEDRPVLARFDRDRNGVLDRAERDSARVWLATQPAERGPGGFGGGRGGASAPVTPGPRVAPADVPHYPTGGFYDPSILRTLFVTFEQNDWEQELAAFRRTDVDVPATLLVDGTTYRDVGVRFRGNSSYSMVPEGRKRPLALSLDAVHEEQALRGYRSLNLLNAINDPTFVRTALYAHIANQYLPAPRVNFVRLVVNGESWGVYPNQQQYNKDFVRDFFPGGNGARWKVPGSPGARGGLEYIGDDIAAYRRHYEIKTKDDTAQWRALVTLTRVLNQTPADQLEAALAPLLNVDGVLRFLAVEMALVNSDGYWSRASDYSLYRDAQGVFHVIPHDMNEALGAGASGPGGRMGRGPGGGVGGPPPGAPPGGGPPMGGPPAGMMRGAGGPGGGAAATLDPLLGLDDATKPLRSKLLAVPALRARYLGYVREIADRWLDWNTLGPLVAQYQALIAEDVRTDGRKLAATDAFTSDVDALRAFATQRRAALLQATAPRD
jgi:hypothetical protein